MATAPRYWAGRGALIAVFAASACGRIGFDATDSDPENVDAAIMQVVDGAIEQVVDATTEQRIDIDSTPHRLGDSVISEGPFFQIDFALDLVCASATIELQIPAIGPNFEAPPVVFLNAMLVGDFTPFYPPVDELDPNWQTNPCGSHDYNGGMSVSLDATGFTALGNNTIRIQVGRNDDDFEFQDLVLRCLPE